MSLTGYGEMDDMYGRMDRMMNSMMNSMMGGMGFMNPMEMLNPMNTMNQLALRSALSHGTTSSSSSSHHHHHHHRHQSASALQPYSPYANQYGHVFPGISSYSSSVVTMTSDGMGRRQVYEASSSTRLAPGGVRETKSAVRDSRTGRHEMSIGHHMHDKSHVIKKSKNVFTGQEDHEEDFVNVEEDEEANFENEWQRRARAGYGRSAYRHAYPSSSRSGLTITELPAEPTRLALTAPPPQQPAPRALPSTAPSSPSARSVPRHDRHRMPYYATAASAPSARATERNRSVSDVEPLAQVNGHRSNGNVTNGLMLASAGPSSARRSESPLDQLRRDRREKNKHKRDRPY